MQTTIWLSVVMASLAIVNTGLMAWLWRFPMKPDPSGRDPHGVSTAPRSWTKVHRIFGYAFTLAYAALLVEMVPRIWEFRAATSISIAHGALGIFVGVLLILKIAVIRRFQRFGHRLPWIGGALAAATLVVAALGVVPAWMVMRPLAPLTPELSRGRAVVSAKCTQCHGASMIAGEREDARKWDRITREMQRFSRRIPRKVPITDEERVLAARFLAHTRGEVEDGERDDEDEDEREEGRRNRGRGRRGRR